jgi:hypothetical protein
MTMAFLYSAAGSDPKETGSSLHSHREKLMVQSTCPKRFQVINRLYSHLLRETCLDTGINRGRKHSL